MCGPAGRACSACVAALANRAEIAPIARRCAGTFRAPGTVMRLFVLAILLLTWPNPPWTLLQWGSAVFMVVLPLAFLRHARILSLSLDLLLRPPERSDLVRRRGSRLGR